MLNAAWLIVHLLAGLMTWPETAAAAPSGVSCTYQACMMKCASLQGSICNSYCDARIRQRVAQGICLRADLDPDDGDIGN